MTISVQQAIRTITNELGDEAVRSGEVPQAKVQTIVDQAIGQMSKADAANVVATLANDAVFSRSSEGYFKGVFGVDKKSLVAALQTSVAQLQSAGGTASLAGAGLAYHGLKNSAPSEKTLSNVDRYFNSPLPGEDTSTLVEMLESDATLNSFGSWKLELLANALTDAPGIASTRVEVFVSTGGKTGPSKRALAEMEEELMNEAINPVPNLSKIIRSDAFLSEMITKFPNSSDKGLAEYLLMPSDIPLAKLVLNYFQPSANAQKADNAMRTLEGYQSARAFGEVYRSRDLPTADKLTHEDAVFIVQERVNDIQLEQRFGRYTVAARTYDGAVSDEQVSAALKLLVGAYGVDVRTNRGDWASDVAGDANDVGVATGSDVSSPAGLTEADYHTAITWLNRLLKQYTSIASLVESVKYVTPEMMPTIAVFARASRVGENQKKMITEAVEQALNSAGLYNLNIEVFARGAAVPL